MNKYMGMTKHELWDAMQDATVEELRQIHKALKKYSKTDGVPFIYRYPDLPEQVGTVALLLTMLSALVISLMLISNG